MKDIAKYFIHGVAFSLIFTVLAIAWVFGVLILIILGSFIGLIIGLGILLLIIGFLNVVLTSWLWFPVKWGFWNILFHGLALLIILIIVNAIFIVAPSLVFPGTATSVFTFIIGAFIDGFVCKKVATLWEEEAPEGIPDTIEEKLKDKNL